MQRINEIRKAFDKAAEDYETRAVIQNEIGERLFERLEYIKIAPKTILDLGSGSGRFSQLLQKRYPKATLVSLDLSPQMLLHSRKKQGWLSKWPLVCANMNALPFANGSFDLVFSNQAVHWSEDLPQLLEEIMRVMNIGGCLLLSTLGPDTFKEMRDVFSQIDNYSHTNTFLDMHDLGDIMLKAKCLDPVIDMEMLSVHYSTISDLLHSIKAQGVRNIHPQRKPGLSGKAFIEQFTSLYQKNHALDDKYPLQYEVIYAHAWRGAQRLDQGVQETMIPISSLRKKKMP
jgi:malonyl-CoA O-methyltransferase